MARIVLFVVAAFNLANPLTFAQDSSPTEKTPLVVPEVDKSVVGTYSGNWSGYNHLGGIQFSVLSVESGGLFKAVVILSGHGICGDDATVSTSGRIDGVNLSSTTERGQCASRTFKLKKNGTTLNGTFVGSNGRMYDVEMKKQP